MNSNEYILTKQTTHDFETMNLISTQTEHYDVKLKVDNSQHDIVSGCLKLTPCIRISISVDLDPIDCDKYI